MNNTSQKIDIPRLLALGKQHYETGNLVESGNIYGQILSTDPAHVESQYMLGLISFKIGRHDAAEKLIGAALAAKTPEAPIYAKLLGDIFRAQGRMNDAIESYKNAAALKPSYIEAQNNLASCYLSQGNIGDAARCFTDILKTTPDYAPALYNMGAIFEKSGKLDEALNHYKKALAVKPDLVSALNGMGNVLKMSGKTEEARKYYESVIKIRSDHSEALGNLGDIYKDEGKTDEAFQCYERAAAATPTPNLLAAMGSILQSKENYDDALKLYSAALNMNPNYVQALDAIASIHFRREELDQALHYNLRSLHLLRNPVIHAAAALAYHKQKKHAEALHHYKEAEKLKPDYMQVMDAISTIYFELGMYESGVAYCEKVLALKPDNHTSLNNTAAALKSFGLLEESIKYFHRALEIVPKKADTYSNLLLTMLYAPSVTPEDLFDASKEFGARIADPLLRKRNLERDKNPERKLRIGYVSPDFRLHPVNYFFEHLLRHHDRAQFEIFGYSTTQKEDAVTERLKKEFSHWRDLRGKNEGHKDDDESADIIEKDEIDILIDLAGHTSHNILPVFARKPAPIQVTWLGYPATTGMRAMDYRLTDPYAEPEGMTEHLNVETLWRLPQIFCCYEPHPDSPAVIDHPPFEDNGHITFGCFNNFSKVTADVLGTWAQIMARIPGSRLLLEIEGMHEPKFSKDIYIRIEKAGIPLNRLTVKNRETKNQFVLYNEIDIALDPFPCVGGTTSMDTIWMGVPFITLAGRHFASRMGVSILNNVGLPELIAKDTDEYIEKAVALATDRERLKATRHGLRGRAVASPMMDQKSFVKNMEATYRKMWRKWCAS